MFYKPGSYRFETPSAPSTPATETPSKKKFGKKLYVLAAIIAIAAITIVLIVPQGAATIPLEVNFIVGEKMVYNTTISMTFQNLNTISPNPLIQTQRNTSVTVMSNIEVIAFDGEYYTLNHTTTSLLSTKPSSIWYLEKVNKTGYSTYMFNFGPQEFSTNTSSSTFNPYLAFLLNKSEVKVGETWPIQLPTINNSAIQMTGDLTMTFKGLEDLTVSAGTYHVFRVDMASHLLNMHINLPQDVIGTNLANSAKITINGQMYTEFGTLRQIKSAIQETVSYESPMANYTMALTLETTLVEHTKP